MNEKTYLKWYNKIGYGSGDIAGNVVYALLSAFVMIFLTDTVGMNAGIVGTLGRLGVMIAGYLGSVPLMLACTAVAAIGMSPLQGDMNALIATCSEYT